jgi:hypothetical protein
MAGINRKEWPEWIGMDGRLASESVADFKRNMQVGKIMSWHGKWCLAWKAQLEIERQRAVSGEETA